MIWFSRLEKSGRNFAPPGDRIMAAIAQIRVIGMGPDLEQDQAATFAFPALGEADNDTHASDIGQRKGIFRWRTRN